MSDHPPQSTVQAVGQAAESVISGLKQQPMLLGVILLNCAFLGTLAWFLSALVHRSGMTMDALHALIKSCLERGVHG